MNNLLLFIISFFTAISIYAQELNCTVQVSSQQIQGSTKEVFNTMQQATFEFMNTRQWTDDVFAIEERIDVSILINITDRLSNEDFKGTIQVSARRPVYGSNYNTTIFSYLDNDVQFKFLQFDPLIFSETTNSSNLTSILAFYAYYIIALDYDSFSPEGGSPYLRKALNVVNNAQSSQEKGWKAFEGTKNRYWLVENYLNKSQFRPLRTCMYQYHREGFDVLAEDAVKGRAAITAALKGLEKLHQNSPNSFNVQLFFIAKVDEIVNLYSKANPEEKAEIVNLLNRIDPGNQNKYQKILKSK